jgi:hypothetical protein
LPELLDLLRRDLPLRGHRVVVQDPEPRSQHGELLGGSFNPSGNRNDASFAPAAPFFTRISPVWLRTIVSSSCFHTPGNVARCCIRTCICGRAGACCAGSTCTLRLPWRGTEQQPVHDPAADQQARDQRADGDRLLGLGLMPCCGAAAGTSFRSTIVMVSPS